MKLYLAAVYTNGLELTGRHYANLTPEEQAKRRGVANILESYHYVHKQSYVDKMRQDGTKVFLDSGAFSSFTMGVNVDIGRYCDFIKNNLDIIEHVDGQPLASVLDAIGDCDGTFRNQAEMERQGVCPLPCFHYNENIKALDWYVQNYSYITLGGMVPVSNVQVQEWLDEIWEYHLTNEDGTPKIKVHGFGFTSIKLMQRYPWYSVDSSSWVQMANNGSVLIPRVEDDPWLVSVSQFASQRKEAEKHMDTQHPPQKESIERHLIELGTMPERLRTEYIARWIHNLDAFPRFIEMNGGGATHFTPDRSRLFRYA